MSTPVRDVNLGRILAQLERRADGTQIVRSNLPKCAAEPRNVRRGSHDLRIINTRYINDLSPGGGTGIQHLHVAQSRPAHYREGQRIRLLLSFVAASRRRSSCANCESESSRAPMTTMRSPRRANLTSTSPLAPRSAKAKALRLICRDPSLG